MRNKPTFLLRGSCVPYGVTLGCAVINSYSMFRQTKSLAFFHYPCVPRNPASVSLYLRARLSVCACVCSCINNCVPSIKHFIGFLSELLQVVPLFNTRLWAACRGHGGAACSRLTSTLNPSRPC